MYKLEIRSYIGRIEVGSNDFEFIADIQKAIDVVMKKHDASFQPVGGLGISGLEQTLSEFDTEYKKISKPAKKRGRPVGSRNKK